jgi:hypothetical protein
LESEDNEDIKDIAAMAEAAVTATETPPRTT